jgi:hypothetical protein
MVQNRSKATAGTRTPHWGEIAFEQSLNELFTPDDAVVLVAGEIRTGKPATAPQRVHRIGTEFGQREPADLDPLHAPAAFVRPCASKCTLR